MNFFQLLFVVSFAESVILFLYATRWYLFSYVSLNSDPETKSLQESCPDCCFVSVMLPVYNEPRVIDRLMNACTSFDYPSYEVVVVDDSNDGITTEKLEKWKNNSKVKVIHRSSRKGWKGGALNVGLEHLDPKSTHVLIFDADFVPPPDLLSKFAQKFNEKKVDVIQGYQKHDLNAEENWITKGVRVWMSLYYMVELNGQQKMGGFSPLTGCVFMIRSDLLKDLKFEEVTDEDWNLTMRLYEKGYKVLFDPSLVASGECPSSLGRLFKQQARWAEGHTRTFRGHFLRIWKCKFLNLREKIDFVFIGASFLNVTLVVLMTLAGLITLVFPANYDQNPVLQLGSLFLLASIPAGVSASLIALHLEDARKDFKKVWYAWLLNYVATPFIAFAALKGLFSRKGYFHRTRKTGKVTRNKEAQ